MSEEEVVQPQEEREETPSGFIDKDKWVEMGRDPDAWRDPDEFAERGEKLNSVLKKQRDELKAEIDAFKNDFTQYRTHQQKITAQKEQEAYERAKREYEQQVSAIRAEKKRAVDEGDGDALIRAEEAQERLAPPRQPVHHEVPQVAPEFVQWQNQNEWYVKDQELKDYADFLSNRYVADVQAGRLTVAGALEKVAGQVKKQFGHKFGNPKRESAAPVEEGAPVRKTAGKTYRDLPPDAREACDRFARKGILTKEQYIKDYFGE